MSRQIALGGSLLLTISATAATAQPAETRTILESDDWETLKSIWRLTDRARSANNYSEFTDGSYDFPIATVKGDSLNTLIGTLFSKTNLENPRIQTAVFLIQKITQTRITRLSRLNMTMLTRMIPPWTLRVRESQLFNFEDRIAALTSLVDTGEITAAEFIAARDTLLERAETLAVLEILEEVYEQADYGYYSDPVDGLDTDIILERLDLSYRAALDTLSKQDHGEYFERYQIAVQQHEEFLQRYNDFKEARPVLRILLTDLMEAKI